MSHFLARLVERARGNAPRVEPIIASRFAPGPESEIPIEDESRGMQGETKQLAAIRSGPTPISGEAIEAPIEVVRETLLVPQFQGQGPSLIVRQQHATAEAEPPEIRVVLGAKSDVSKPESRQPKPAKLQLSPLQNEPPNQAPIVRVTIGRVEVRAVQQSEQPRPAKREKPQPRLTLEEYLLQRRQGKR